MTRHASYQHTPHRPDPVGNGAEAPYRRRNGLSICSVRRLNGTLRHVPYAVQLLLDARAAEKVRGVWNALRDAGVSSIMIDLCSRPHVTLAVYEDLEVEPFETQVKAFFAGETSIDVPLSGVGTFHGEEGVLYCSPVVTPELLALHERFHKRFDHLAEGAWAYYRPGSWVPHCTLAMLVPDHLRGEGIDVVLKSGLPTRTRLGAVSVVRFEPGYEQSSSECFEASFGV